MWWVDRLCDRLIEGMGGVRIEVSAEGCGRLCRPCVGDIGVGWGIEGMGERAS